MNEAERLLLVQQASAALDSAMRDHGWDSPEAETAHQQLLEVERTTAAEMGLPYATAIDLGARWDPGAPMPCLLAGVRTFLVYYLRSDDPIFEELSPDEPGWDQERGVGIIEFRRVASVKMGSPNEEVAHGHPLWGYGLEFYGAHVVTNSPWIKELADINRVHPQFTEKAWAAARHYVLPFHDETVECVAQDATAWTELRSMGDVVRDLSSEALKSPPK
jgi:hypothetical protein